MPSNLRSEIAESLKHYYLYMKQCELAGDSKISHTAVKGAINDANELNEKIIDQILNLIASRLEEKAETYTHYIGDGKFKAIPLDSVKSILKGEESQ
jgi:hypothetical protein